jgi:uncharacterized protein (TIGR02246 family)
MDQIFQPRELIDAIGDALNGKDAQSLGKLFSEDAVFVNVRGVRMHGRRQSLMGTPPRSPDPCREAPSSLTQFQSCVFLTT